MQYLFEYFSGMKQSLLISFSGAVLIYIIALIILILKNKNVANNIFHRILIGFYVFSMLGGVLAALAPLITINGTTEVTYMIIFGIFGFILFKYSELKFENFNRLKYFIIFLPWLFALSVTVADAEFAPKVFFAKTVILASLLLFSGFWLSFSFGLFGSTTLNSIKSTLNVALVLAFIIWSTQTVVKPAWQAYLTSIKAGVATYIIIAGMLIQTVIEAYEHRKLYGRFVF